MRLYDDQELKDILAATIRDDKRHAHYDRTVEHAEFCRQIMTGDDQDELIISYKKRETEEQKEQRIEITNSRTKYVGNRVQSVFKKVQKVDNVVDNINYKEGEGDEEENLKKLDSRLNKFSTMQDLATYLHEAVLHLNFYDPNAFLIVEMRKDDNGEVWTYPLEVYSDQAINYEYKHNDLQYLIFRNKHTYVTKEGDAKEGFIYYLYSADFAIQLDELGEREEAVFDDEKYDEKVLIKKSEDKTIVFGAQYFNTKSKIQPAIQVGYVKDAETNRETFVSPLDPAEHVVKDLINTKSEYDLHRALHGFIQKFAYANVCEHKEEIHGQVMDCKDGYMDIDRKHKCPNCEGRGLIMHSSVQDILLVKMPDEKSEHIPLDQMVHYVEIPDHIIKRHKDDLEKLEKDVSYAIFNIDVFDRSEIAVTATEKKINLESVYDVLSEYGSKWSQIYKHFVKVTSIHLLIDDGLIVEHKFPADFHLESVDELLTQRKAAVDAGAPYEVISRIDKNILSKQLVDDQDYLQFMMAKETFRPFKEKSLEEKLFLMSGLPDDNPTKVLYVYFENIFEDIYNTEKKPPFYKRNYEDQWEIIEKKIEEYTDEPEEKPSFRHEVAAQAGQNEE